MTVARILFRAKVLDAILKALTKGQLLLPPNMTECMVRKMLTKLSRKKWNVSIQEKYQHGKGILTYLARYLRGGPIGNFRIAKVDATSVTFDIGRKSKKLLTLPIPEFIRRFLQYRCRRRYW